MFLRVFSINLSVDNSPYKTEPTNITVSSVPENSPLPAADIPKKYDMWYYVSTLKNTTTEDDDDDDDAE